MAVVFRENPPQKGVTPELDIIRIHPPEGVDPRNLSTECITWCRADAGVTLNGTTVSAWADYSGKANNFTQSTAGSQPTWVESGLGGRPELSFDGTDDNMTGLNFYGSLSAKDEWTVILVVRNWAFGPSGNPWAGYGVFGAPSGGANYFNIAAIAKANGGIGYHNYNGSANQTATGGNTSMTAGEAAVVLCACSGGTGFTRVNGSQGSSNASVGSIQSSATTVNLGKGTQIASNDPMFWPGTVSEVLVFDGALSSGDISIMESYLLDRYGI